MAVHPPKDFSLWSKTKQKAWTDRWGQQNDIGKVVVDAAEKVPLNNTPDTHHALPGKKKVLSVSPGDESAPSGVERTRRGDARLQKMRNVEQKKVDKRLADELKRDEELLQARLDRAKANAQTKVNP